LLIIVSEVTNHTFLASSLIGHIFFLLSFDFLDAVSHGRHLVGLIFSLEAQSQWILWALRSIEIFVLLILGLDISLTFVIVNLHFHEPHLFLQTRYFSLGIIFIETLFGYKLSSKILDLTCKLLLDSLIFNSHDVSPDDVELVQNLWNTCLGHLSIKSWLKLSNFLNSLGRNPLIGIMILLLLSCGCSFVSYNAKCITDLLNTLVAEVFCFSHDIGISNILVLCSFLEELDQFLVVSFQVVKLNMNGSFSLSWAIKITYCLLELSYLVPQSVILFRFHFEFFFNIGHSFIHLLEAQFIHFNIIIFLF